MKIACPKCGTRFTVPDKALGAHGRTLKCARCANTWHQDPPAVADDAGLDGLSDPDRTPVAASRGDHAPLAEHLETPPDPPAPPQGRGRTLLDDPPPAPPPSNTEPVGQTTSGGHDMDAEDLPDFDDILARLEDQERERAGRREGHDDPTLFGDDDELPNVLRNGPRSKTRSRRPPALASLGLAGVVLLAGLLGALYFLRDTVVGLIPATEGIYQTLGIPLSRPGLGLRLEQVVPTRERVNGEDILVVRGFINNFSETERPVPALQLMLNDADGEMIQRMVTAPPTAVLPAGDSVPFRMTLRNQLPGAASIEVTFTDRPPEPMVTPPGQSGSGAENAGGDS